MRLKKEISCGCIIIKNNKILLVYEKRRNFWGLPKGHVEQGESEEETALREVREEVGLDVEIDKTKRYTLNYIINNEIDKTSVFYIAKPKNEDIKIQESEIGNIKWCSFEEAVELLTFEDWKQMLKIAIINYKKGENIC